jgi:hypothetical protein
MPYSDVSKSMTFYENSILDKKIDHLKKEIKREENLSNINKNRKYDDIEKRIIDLRDYFIQSKNRFEKADFNNQYEKYKEIEKSYQEIIKLNEEREKEDDKKRKNSEKKMNQAQQESSDKPNQPIDITKSSDLKINLKNMLEYLNENLHNNKNMALKESNELKNKIIHSEKEKKKYNDYKLICDDVIKKAKNLLNSKPTDVILNDLREVDFEVAKINSYIEVNI